MIVGIRFLGYVDDSFTTLIIVLCLDFAFCSSRPSYNYRIG